MIYILFKNYLKINLNVIKKGLGLSTINKNICDFNFLKIHITYIYTQHYNYIFIHFVYNYTPDYICTAYYMYTYLYFIGINSLPVTSTLPNNKCSSVRN